MHQMPSTKTEPNCGVPCLRCPTCGAEQTYSDICRRCKCDLSLVHRLLEYRDALTHRCLLQLRDQQPAHALKAAQQCYAIAADHQTARRLAVVYLLIGDYRSAVDVFKAAHEM